MKTLVALLFALVSGVMIAISWAREVETSGAQPPASTNPTVAITPADPAPLSGNVQKGIEYLVEHQDSSGGWGQGGGWRQNSKSGGRVEGKEVKDPPDVGSTCIAVLSLLRAGSTPKEGPYASQISRGIDFVLEHVEHADDKSVYVTDIRDTQLQVKIGRYVDTFLTGLVLSELKGKMADAKSEDRVGKALAKTIKKIELNMNADGNFAGNTGWASVLSQGLCSKALNRAKGVGVAVSEETLQRDYNSALAALEPKATTAFAGEGSTSGIGGAGIGAGISAKPSGAEIAGIVRPAGPKADPVATTAPARPATAGTDAGVRIYNEAANTARIDELVQGNKAEKVAAQAVLEDSAAPADAKAKAQDKLTKVLQVEKSQQAAVDGIMKKLDDKQFIQGFGNNGGEEYLSYMNISETLAARGGAEWDRWNKNIALSINRVQNQDGSWSGDHCITGRTFCTAAALLTLMADRAPAALAARQQTRN